MASIVYRTDKKTGAQYAYRSESYRDPVTHKPRNRKEYLGRVDPETGEIIPKKQRAQGGEPQPTLAPITPAPITDDTNLAARVAALEAENVALRAELETLRAALTHVLKAMNTMEDGIDQVLQTTASTGA